MLTEQTASCGGHAEGHHIKQTTVCVGGGGRLYLHDLVTSFTSDVQSGGGMVEGQELKSELDYILMNNCHHQDHLYLCVGTSGV